MERTLENISDGKLYDIEDMVNADTKGCNGCSACCHNVGDLVALTPFDAYEIKSYLDISFDELIGNKITLRENNKVLLPYLKMQGEENRCSFLDAQNRCAIHAHRPNICRLFPLGRVYENNNFKYFLQVGSCLKPTLSPVKVSEWIGIQHYEANKELILIWHQLIKALAFRLKFVFDEKERQDIQNKLINAFYRIEVQEGEDFYAAFARVLPEAKRELGIL
ncbi:YkgJ family cysteine cluster protein [Cellulosilyticum ruminicola]|uniref:YkgJ family cysteine cluster protein n=1 Tax=Cellulosilyticum ruminicola TaxID=425254 RepID=UPI0006D2A5B0|nr:YkgJ family cysteine cluster protein [Cellulosilyticum ruminicola]